MPLSAGTRLGPYEILAPIGAGGMGEVYRAQDRRLGRHDAIKILPAKFTSDQNRVRRFVQEAKADSALHQPNITTVYDIGEADGQNFMVMEFVDGKSLDQLIPRKGLRLDEVLRYAIQIADALAAAHAAGIVHRDLKPGNVMVTGAGQVKVLEFGLAKLREPRTSQESQLSETITAEPVTEEGAVLGTVAYMSPEQAEGRNVDARSDIFAFGALLFEMATGRRAFEGGSKLATMSAILRENAKAPSELAADIPSDLDKIVLRRLRKDPARRYQSMSDLKISLEDLEDESGAGIVRPGTARRKPDSE